MLTTGVLFSLSYVEDALATWRTTAELHIEMDPSPELSRALKQRVRELGLYRRSWRVSRISEGFVLARAPDRTEPRP